MYRVLARKYRPTTFADLIGQEVLVRTLTNAFQSGRIAHAFILTGIRGIGKTTTARIIARGLNCIGPDGNGEPTTTPCGVCPNCKMIAEDRHVDVIEMDAASRTGVDDIRDIIDSVQYAPVSGRYKVYIIDEVHMLSKNAFNALLKTLEEPPPHVKFIFATTEIRKIPVTIISRCQRFDLRRLDTDGLAAHLVDIAARESISLPEECAQLIAASAEGSVRDALSMLDQAIAMHTDETGATNLTAESLRNMLGMADKSHMFALLQHVLEGRSEEALQLAADMSAGAADSAMMLGDLLEITHYLTRLKAAPKLAADVHYSGAEQELGKVMAEKISVASLTRAWQILCKANEEMRFSNNPKASFDMLLVRLAYASQLPTPAALIRSVQNGSFVPAAAPAPRPGNVQSLPTANTHGPIAATPRTSSAGATALAPVLQPNPISVPQDFQEVVALFEQHREPILMAHLRQDLRLVNFTVGRIAFQPAGYIAPDVPVRIQRKLNEWTGMRWSIAIVDAQGEATLAEQQEAEKARALEYAANHPHVRAVLDAFTDAEIIDFIPNKS
jgi:DNA polymerase-3 subunit gamma/tau